MTEYGISVTLAADFPESVERTRAALADQGFGILTEIDVAATMRAKLDVDMAPYVILGACNPPLAHQAIRIDPSIGLLLPCNVVVRSLDDTHTLVETMDPDVMITATNRADLATVADQARSRLTAALAALTGTQSGIDASEPRSTGLLSTP
jgi:uncharacterized protein (DUF302 family)